MQQPKITHEAGQALIFLQLAMVGNLDRQAAVALKITDSDTTPENFMANTATINFSQGYAKAVLDMADTVKAMMEREICNYKVN